MPAAPGAKFPAPSGPNSGTKTTSTGPAPNLALNPATAWRNLGESGDPKTMMGLFCFCKGPQPQLPKTSVIAINHSRAVDSFRFSVFGFRMKVLVLIENIMV